MKTTRFILVALLLGWAGSTPSRLQAHCDTLDGPVVKAAQRALEERNASLVLIWVQPADEPEIQRVFRHALAVRGTGAEARELADRFFLETVVRVHRAGEDAPFTGLKPAASGLNPAIVAADRSIETGRIEPVLKLLTLEMTETLQRLHAAMRAAAGYNPRDVAAGRAWVRAYVEYIHAVEGLYQAVHPSAEEHHSASETSSHQGHASPGR
jgi:hypothetical protein